MPMPMTTRMGGAWRFDSGGQHARGGGGGAVGGGGGGGYSLQKACEGIDAVFCEPGGYLVNGDVERWW